MPDPTTTTGPLNPDPVYRLGCANELLAQLVNPTSVLRQGALVDGWAYIEGRLRLHLDREAQIQRQAGQDPSPYGETRPAVIAPSSSIPWPMFSTGGLQPGDIVTHCLYGVGVLAAFNDQQWEAALPLVAAGTVLVFFEGDASHWCRAEDLARPQPAVPCCDPESPF